MTADTHELELSIVMPCLNEKLTLPGCIREALAFLSTHNVAGEVVIADNGSTDGSQELARSLGARVVDVPIKGYGAALQAGCTSARGRYLAMGDSDGSYDFSLLGVFLTELRAGADLVMGNRFRGQIFPGAMPVMNRYLGNPVLSGLGRFFFRTPIRDFHCGLRAFSKSAFERLGLVTSGMEFASEMVIKATLMGLKTVEVPTNLRKDGRDRPPHLRPWRDGWRHLRFMLLYSPRWLFLYPGMLMMLLGTVFGALLIRGPLVIGGVGFDVHSMLYAAVLVLVGFQSLTFSVFARILALREGLLPATPRLTSLFGVLNMEVGLAAGGLMTLTGLGLAVAATSKWSATGFGGLDPQAMLRLVIPSATLMCLGVETIFASFFLSMLGLRTNRLSSK